MHHGASEQRREREAFRTLLQRTRGPALAEAVQGPVRDPKRLSLLIRLAEERELCTVGKVAEGAGIDLSVVSRHLAILREAGIIKCERRGKEVWCEVQTASVAELLRDLAGALEACCLKGWRVPVEPEAAPAPRR